MKSFEEWINRFCYWMAKVSAFFILLLIVITMLQVMIRYLFHNSSNALEELKWHFFGLIFLLSMGYAYKEKEHVRVDIFYQFFSKKTKAIIESVGIGLIILPFSLILMVFGFKYSYMAYQYDNGVPLDSFMSSFFENKTTYVYYFFSTIESYIREWIVRGEMSPNQGGLEARWVIKSVIPLGFFVLFLQSVTIFLENIRILIKK